MFLLTLLFANVFPMGSGCVIFDSKIIFTFNFYAEMSKHDD